MTRHNVNSICRYTKLFFGCHFQKHSSVSFWVSTLSHMIIWSYVWRTHINMMHARVHIDFVWIICMFFPKTVGYFIIWSFFSICTGKMPKNDQNWPKTTPFGIFCKFIPNLVLILIWKWMIQVLILKSSKQCSNHIHFTGKSHVP